MNILYALTEFPVLSESFVLNEIQALEARGHTITVVALREGESEALHDEISRLSADVHYIGVPSALDFTSLLRTRSLRPGVWQTISTNRPILQLGALTIAYDIVDICRSLPTKIDHIHSHFPSRDKIGAGMAAEIMDISFSITCHANLIFESPDEIVIEQISQFSNAIVTISEYHRQYLAERFSMYSRKIAVVRASIDTDKFSPTSCSSSSPRLLTVGRLVEKKGYETAVQAVDRLVKDYPGLQYHIVGTGPLKTHIQTEIRKRELEENIQMISNISDSQLLSEYDYADIFLLPCTITNTGDRDGIPVVLMEAMAMHTPPVTTDVAGIPELVEDNQNGMLADRDSPIDTAKKAEQLLQNPDLIKQMANQGRKKVEREFSAEKSAKSLEEVFKPSD